MPSNVNFPSSSSQKIQGIWTDDYPVCDEGNYFVATNATPGTAITGTICVDDAATASSTHAQFAPFFMLFNTANAANQNSPNIYLRYFRLFVRTAPASATEWDYSIRSDVTNRYSSGGTLITPVNPNTGAQKTSVAQLYAGAIVPTALPSASSRLLATGIQTGGIPVVKDQYFIRFGNDSISMDQINNGSGTKNIAINAPPIIIAPGTGIQFDQWGASNATTAGTWEFELAWVERLTGL